MTGMTRDDYLDEGSRGMTRMTRDYYECMG